MTADEAPSLHALAETFASELTDLTRGVLGKDSPPFRAVESGGLFKVRPITSDEVVQHLPITIGRENCLSLLVRYSCCLDGSRTFIAVQAADFHLFYVGSSDPLIRFEYVRSMGSNYPAAHIHVHASRDEVAFLLRLAEAGRPRTSFNKRQIPRFAELHLPVGGHRMRPGLEDVLLFLKREFAIDTEENYRSVLNENLRRWRQLQLRAAVRDSPEDAVEVLEKLGYRVAPPEIPPARESLEANKLFLP